MNILELSKLDIDTSTKPLIINNIMKEDVNIDNLQIGFYLILDDLIEESIIFSVTNFFDFNIEIKIKSNYDLHINENNTGLRLNKNNFFYIKAEFLWNYFNIIIRLNSNSNFFSYKYNVYFDNFNMNWVTYILGSNKKMLNYKFIGKINYLNYKINKITDYFDNFKNIESEIIIMHNLKNNGDSNYIMNEINNGFSGSVNGENLYDNIKNVNNFFQYYNRNKKFLNEFIFKTENAYINLSKDFIDYTSIHDVISYSVYLSLSINQIFCWNNNVLDYNYLFYKRNSLKFELIIKNCVSNNEFKYFINSSYKIEKRGLSSNITYFKTIFMKILYNINYSNYSVNYRYFTNKDSRNEFNTLGVVNNENHDFLSNDQHYNGVFNTINNLQFNIEINLYEIYLILGTSFKYENENIYSKWKDNDIVLYCNGSIDIKNRDESYNLCINDNRIGKSYNIEDCILIKGSICLKCIPKKKLENNICIDNDFETYNNINKLTKYILLDSARSRSSERIHKYNFSLGSIKSKIYFKITLNLNDEKYVYFKISLNDKIIKYINNNISYSISELKFVLEFYLDGENNILIEKIDNNAFGYDIEMYIFDYDNEINLIDPYHCLYKYGDKFLPINKDYMLFNCINKFNIPENYYINQYDIILKCNEKCEKCLNAYICIKCKPNYFLYNKKCIKINNKNCDEIYDINLCKKCNNTKNILVSQNYLCYGSCYTGCKICKNSFYNSCLSCIEGYLFYPETNICINSSKCLENHIKLLELPYCIKNCKNQENKCISCYNYLFLSNELNKCIECLKIEGYFKNYLILDNENKPTCEKCDISCKTCEDSKYKCTSCNNNKYLIINNFTCTDQCPPRYYKKNHFCISCNSDCLFCSENNHKCLQCDNNKLIKYNKCVKNCDYGFYIKNKECLKCSNNCKVCNNMLECTICEENFYWDNKQLCVKCVLKNQFISKNICLNCHENCESCKNNKNNCLSCNNDYYLKKIDNLNICLKNCKNNFYFDIQSNSCKNCNECEYCYKNESIICNNCPKCQKTCDLKFEFNNDGIIIKSSLTDTILFNKNFSLKNVISNNIIYNNILKLTFKPSDISNINLVLSNNLFISTKNCYGFNSKNINIIKSKLNCDITDYSIINKKNKLILILNTNIIFNSYNFIIKIKQNNRDIDYKIDKFIWNNKNTKIYLQLLPNYYKNNFDISITIKKKMINKVSFCNPKEISKVINIFFKTNNFENDSEIIKKQLLKTEDLNIIENISSISKNYKSSVKNSSVFIMIINIFNSSNILLFLSIIQLVYILEFILLLPINIGGVTNSFVKYFKWDFEININLNGLIKINKNESKKYYEKTFLSNPKIKNVSWLNISIIKFEILLIFILFILKIFILILRRFLYYLSYELIAINKLILEIRVYIFKFIESFKTVILAIIMNYLSNIYLFEISLNNIKIFTIIILYYLFFSYYIKILIDLAYLLMTNTWNKYNKQDKLFYRRISLFELDNLNKYTLYQFLHFIKEFLFVAIIFLINNFKYNVLLFLIVEIIFWIYVLCLNSEKDFFVINKIKFEEVVNFFLIISIILNYIGYQQFQLSFIISYIFWFAVNFLILFYEIFTLVFKFVYKIILKIRNKFK